MVKKIIKIVLVIIFLVIFWVVGTMVTMGIHEEKFIKYKNHQLVIDVKNEIDNFDKFDENQLLRIHEFYTAAEGNTPLRFFVKKISVLSRTEKRDYVVEFRTVYNIKIYDTLISGKLDQTLEKDIGFKDHFEGLEEMVENQEKIEQESEELEKVDNQYEKRSKVLWKSYRNIDLGIEFEYPSSALAYDHYWDGNYDKCEGIEGEKQISVPYKVFTIDNYIFIKEEYYYEVDRSHNCKKIFNNAELLFEEYKKRGNYPPPWSIKFIKIDDEKELGDYIVNNFGWGGGCSLGSIIETTDKGVFDVVINQDGIDMGDTTCGVNYRHYLKYIPSKKMLFRLDNGHECIINGILGDCFDEQIVNSMNFF